MKPEILKKTRLDKEKGRLEMKRLRGQWQKQGKNFIREAELLNRQNYGQKS